MAPIWRDDGMGWRPLAPTGFPDEATLHTLVERAPQLLPLAGAPRLVVIGREVLLGNGYADLLAIEPSGRLAVIEIKLARNSEARRAVVSQVLAYAAYLNGSTVEDLEQRVLEPHLRKLEHKTLAEAVKAQDQQHSFDAAEFRAGLEASLTQGRFRLVIVLDAAPSELIRLVGYLESVSDKWLIDLVTVAAYEVNGSQVLVPQRVEGERWPKEKSPPLAYQSTVQTRFSDGGEDFAAAIEESPPGQRAGLLKAYNWALGLEREGLVKLGTYRGKAVISLLPRLLVGDVGLVTIYNGGGAYLQLWRSVFERRAPQSLPKVERLIGQRLGQGTAIHNISDELLGALSEAYREAAG